MTTTPTTTTTTPPSTPILFGPLNVEYLNESWCDLQYKSGCSSTGSISHLNHSVNPEILEKLLQEAQKDASSQRQSPTLLPPPASNQVPMIKSGKKTTKMSKSATSVDVAKDQSLVIKTLTMSGFSDLDDEDVDLEYVEGDDEEADDDDDTNVVDENGDMSSYGTIRSKLKTECGSRHCADELLNRSPHASTPCPNCLKQKKQIDLLIERQVKNEKELIRMRNEYEVKLLNKSLEISTHHTSPPSTRNVVVSSSDYNILSSNISSARSVASSSSGANTPGQVNSQEWVKYFASRPQTQPPKEWNLVHPNSSKSKYAKFESSVNNTTATMVDTSKWLSRESLSKLIFTHMASFIVGATLMFLMLKRHMNFKNTFYFI